jgi:mannose-1-phosphate guanylyltransferase / phosphomannomutase
LRPYTENRSKPMVPIINNFPILELIIYSLTKGANLRNYIFGSKGPKNYTNLQNYFQGGSGWSGKTDVIPRVHFEYQNPNYGDSGNADSVRYNVKTHGIKSPIIVCQSDNLFWGEDVKKLYEYAMHSPYDFTIGLTQVKDASQLGVAHVGQRSHRITKFREKPGTLCKAGGLVNTGIYVIKPNAFKVLKGDFGKDVIPKLTAQNMVGGFIFEHPWYDLGNSQEHLNSVLSLLKNPTPHFEDFLSKVCTEYKNGRVRVWIRGRSNLSLKMANALIKKIEMGKIIVEGCVFIGKGSVIKDGVYLKDCAIGDFSHVGSESEIVRSNILDAWEIGKNCKIYDSFFGRGGTMSDGNIVSKKFLGDNSTVLS